MIFVKSLTILLISFNLAQASPLTTITNVEELKPQIKKALKNNAKRFKVTDQSKDHFIERYFKPWKIQSMSFAATQAQWGNGYRYKKMYKRDGKRVKKNWFTKQIKAANFKQYNKLKEKAITVKEAELKVFPTTEAFYLDPKRPGEGYPFDYNTNSAVKLNLPLFVSHYSKDRKWVYVESSTAAGWLKREEISFVNDKFVKDFMTGDYCISTRDDSKVKTDKKIFNVVKMGTLFPKKGNKLLTCDKNGRGVSKIRYVEDIETVEPMGIEMNYENIVKISENLLNEPYGWGGKDGLRDCSLLTKDFMSSFGIFLERNSRAQRAQGKEINLANLTNKQKKKVILEKGIPFLTLLYMNGHVMLYVGEKDNEPMIMHNVWTLKFDRGGERKLKKVGKGVITTLDPGALHINDKNSILSKLKSLVFVNKG